MLKRGPRMPTRNPLMATAMTALLAMTMDPTGAILSTRTLMLERAVATLMTRVRVTTLTVKSPPYSAPRASPPRPLALNRTT